MSARHNQPGWTVTPRQDRDLRPDPASGSGSPVIILSYAYSGAAAVQQALADGTNLACTTGTGILPLCEVAAASWARVEERPANSISQLAISSVRALVSAQLTVLLAAMGSGCRWCELAISGPSAAAAFLQIVPAARIVCVHRDCREVVAAAARAQPWGVAGSVMAQFAFDFPGNTAAAIAAYWVAATERLLAFEAANPQAAIRLRYEDAMRGTRRALTGVQSALQLQPTSEHWVPPDILASAGPDGEDLHTPEPPMPVEMIPAELRNRIVQLQAELGYPLLAPAPSGHPG
jgi:hypothetical protein